MKREKSTRQQEPTKLNALVLIRKQNTLIYNTI